MKLSIITVSAFALIAAANVGCSDATEASAPETNAAPVEVAASTPEPVITTPPAVAPKAQTTEPASWAGSYEGPFEGGQGTVRITEVGPSQQVEVAVVGEGGCSGQARGAGRIDGPRLVLDIPIDPQTVCSVTMERNGRNLAVSESGCESEHGMACAFSGTARRTR